jgi:hypothetical protein
VLILSRDDDSYTASASWLVDGSIRALAARVEGAAARLAAAVAGETGETSLVLIDVARRSP